MPKTEVSLQCLKKKKKLKLTQLTRPFAPTVDVLYAYLHLVLLTESDAQMSIGLERQTICVFQETGCVQ